MHGAQAVGAGIATSDNDDPLPFRTDEIGISNAIALDALVRERQVLHRKVNALELATRHWKIARQSGAAREHNRVELSVIWSNVTSTPTFTLVRK